MPRPTRTEGASAVSAVAERKGSSLRSCLGRQNPSGNPDLRPASHLMDVGSVGPSSAQVQPVMGPAMSARLAGVGRWLAARASMQWPLGVREPPASLAARTDSGTAPIGWGSGRILLIRIIPARWAQQVRSRMQTTTRPTGGLAPTLGPNHFAHRAWIYGPMVHRSVSHRVNRCYKTPEVQE